MENSAVRTVGHFREVPGAPIYAQVLARGTNVEILFLASFIASRNVLGSSSFDLHADQVCERRVRVAKPLARKDPWSVGH